VGCCDDGAARLGDWRCVVDILRVRRTPTAHVRHAERIRGLPKLSGRPVCVSDSSSHSAADQLGGIWGITSRVTPPKPLPTASKMSLLFRLSRFSMVGVHSHSCSAKGWSAVMAPWTRWLRSFCPNDHGLSKPLRGSVNRWPELLGGAETRHLSPQSPDSDDALYSVHVAPSWPRRPGRCPREGHEDAHAREVAQSQTRERACSHG
jgi:hypothetical protein